MAKRIYRAPLRYWVESILSIAFVAWIPVVIVGGIPGFPHQVVAGWRRFYSHEPFGAVVLALVWTVVPCKFGYLSFKGIRDLIWPRRLCGVLEPTEDFTGKSDTFWIQLSGIRSRARYDQRLYQCLRQPGLAGATVELKVGVGNRIVSIDLIKN
jgi:hypothetical protein